MINFTGAWETLLNWMGIETENGESVASRNPLSYPPVWYAVSKIGGHIGYLPIDLKQEQGRNIRKVTNHPSYQLLRWKPNKFQTPLQFKRACQLDALLYGNSVSYIYRPGGRLKELVPLPMNGMIMELKRGRKKFTMMIDVDDPLASANPSLAGTYHEFDQDEVLHIAGLGSNGVWGHSVLSLARDSWEAGMGGIKRLKTLTKKGYAGGLMLNAPPGSSISRDDEKAKRFLNDFEKRHSGADKSGVVGLLREGVTAEIMQMSQQDAQFVETMKFLRQDEALRFCLEQILGDDSSVSYSSLEQKNLAYLQNCLNTWLCAWEEELDTKLLTPSEQRNGYYHKFNTAALLRSDTATTVRTFSLAITSRIMSPNEAREKLDLNPYEGGDTYENPNTTAGLGMRDDEIDTEPTRQPQGLAKVQIEHMLSVEAKRIAKFARLPGNFLDKIDSFYAKWESSLADCLEKLGGDRTFAEMHCMESKGQLLLLCDTCKQDELAAQVEQLVSTWVGRSSDIVEQMEDAGCFC
jgi:HK97 family phage portal protein